MSRRTEARNLDLDLEQRENEATLSQDDSTDTEHEASTPRGSKTSSVSRKSNLSALTGNPSKLGKKQQLSILPHTYQKSVLSPPMLWLLRWGRHRACTRQMGRAWARWPSAASHCSNMAFLLTKNVNPPR